MTIIVLCIRLSLILKKRLTAKDAKDAKGLWIHIPAGFVGTEILVVWGQFPQVIQRIDVFNFTRITLNVGIEQIFPRCSYDGTRFNFQQIDVPQSEDGKALE